MKRIRNIFQIGFLLVLSVVLTGCSKDEPKEDPNTSNSGIGDNNSHPVIVSEDEIIGTWKCSGVNTDYISFNGNGQGIMATAADLFINTGSHKDEHGVGEMITFRYQIDQNIITVSPIENNVKDFTIEVTKTSKNKLELSFPAGYLPRKKSMNLFSEDWEWFAKEGPASIDLTTNFCGDYVVDSNGNHKLQVSKINDYTIKIEDLYLNYVTIGWLYWRDLYNNSGLDHITIWQVNNSTDAGYYFSLDGKLYSMGLRKHYFEGGATKVE